MPSYFPFQILPILDSEMLAWVLYDDQMRVVGTGADVTESDAKTAMRLLAARHENADSRSWREVENRPH